MYKVLLLSCVFAIGGIGQAADLPEELAPLQQLMEDEERLVAAVRTYDLAQQALAEWDIDLAQSYAEQEGEKAGDAKASQAKRRFELVKLAWEAVLDRYPNNARAMNYYGETLYDQFGQGAKAIELWKTASAYDETLSEPYNNLSIHYMHHGDYDLGMRNAEKAIELSPNNPDYHFNMAQNYLNFAPYIEKRNKWSREKVYAEVMKHSKRASELAPSDYTLLLDYATNFYAAERFDVDVDWDEAADVWARARLLAREKEQIFFTWLNEARASIRKGDKLRAEMALREALNVMPGNGVATSLMTNLDAQIEKEQAKKKKKG